MGAGTAHGRRSWVLARAPPAPNPAPTTPTRPPGPSTHHWVVLCVPRQRRAEPRVFGQAAGEARACADEGVLGHIEDAVGGDEQGEQHREAHGQAQGCDVPGVGQGEAAIARHGR